MRSFAEIRFRLRQESRNLYLYKAAPKLERIPPAAPLPHLPDPAEVIVAIQGTPWAADLLEEAERILRHEFRVLGVTLHAGPTLDWRKDYLGDATSQPKYFRRVPYLDFAQVGDHKIIWELNRHHHLVVLAQAWRLTGDERYKSKLFALLESWQRDNPVQRGINWASALEVAFRALSWAWVYHLTASDMTEEFRAEFLTGLYRHGLHLDANLSVYFSPNTHLLGEAVALHAVGVLFPFFPDSQRWVKKGARIVEEQMQFQVCPDGSHFEQSSYYHIYALDLFVFHSLLQPVSSWYRQRLHGMADYARSLLGPAWSIPLWGDDDGGRLFHPFGIRAQFGRASMATCSVLLNRGAWLRNEADFLDQALWWIGPAVLDKQPLRSPELESLRYPDSGMTFLQQGDVQAAVDAGPFGWGGAGHSHSDTLSLVLRRGGEEILIDPGTFTYISDPHWRDWFRGSAAHNTLRIAGKNQAGFQGPFRWESKPVVECLEWKTEGAKDLLEAKVIYEGFAHRRVVVFEKPDFFLIIDEVSGPAGQYEIEQFWHFGVSVRILHPFLLQAGSVEIAFDERDAAELQWGGENGWKSEVFAQKEEAPVVRCRRFTELPARFVTCINLSPAKRRLLPRVTGAGVAVRSPDSIKCYGWNGLPVTAETESSFAAH